MADYRKMTVSEFLRESKPDWEHVATREKRSSTRPFSGPLTVRPPGRHDWSFLGENCQPEPLQDQADAQMRQILGLEEPMTLHGEEIVEVDDSGGQIP